MRTTSGIPMMITKHPGIKKHPIGIDKHPKIDKHSGIKKHSQGLSSYEGHGK